MCNRENIRPESGVVVLFFFPFLSLPFFNFINFSPSVKSRDAIRGVAFPFGVLASKNPRTLEKFYKKTPLFVMFVKVR